jgi:hypothetical protein
VAVVRGGHDRAVVEQRLRRGGSGVAAAANWGLGPSGTTMKERHADRSGRQHGAGRRTRARIAVGWLAVGLSTFFSALWAFWGSIENFHEGWYYRELWRNVGLAVVQYLPWMFVLMGAALVALWHRWLGVVTHLTLAALALWFFGWRGSAGAVLIAAPLAGLAALYGLGEPEPRSWARRTLVAIPLATALVSGAYPGYRVFTRPTAVDLSMHRLTDNGVDLVWAPAGPGWDLSGFSWFEATRRCDYLADDGASLAETAQHIWRLPTADEAVRSMIYRGHNAGGTWDAATHTARFRMMPDKEAPLWHPYSQVIYWWTADEDVSDAGRAYRVVYNGRVNTVAKRFGAAYIACRCVKTPR